MVEAIVYMNDLDTFVTIMLLENSPAALSLSVLCEDMGYSEECGTGEPTSLSEDGRTISCKSEKHVRILAGTSNVWCLQ